MTVSALLQVATGEANAAGAITLTFQPVSQGGVWQGSVSVPGSTAEVWAISIGGQQIATVTGSSPYGPLTIQGGQTLSLSAITAPLNFLAAVINGVQGYGPDDVAALPPSVPSGSPTLAPVFSLLGSLTSSGGPLKVVPSSAALQLVIVGPQAAPGQATVVGVASGLQLPVAGASSMTVAALPGTPADQIAGYNVFSLAGAGGQTFYVYQSTVAIIDLSEAPISSTPQELFGDAADIFVAWGATAVLLENPGGAGGTPTVADANGITLPVTQVSPGLFWFPVSSPAFGPFDVTWPSAPGLWYAVPVDVNPFETSSASGGGGGSGLASTVIVPSPLPGADWTYTLPTAARVQAVTARLITSAAAANRFPGVQMNAPGDADALAYVVGTGAAVTASEVLFLSYFTGGSLTAVTVAAATIEASAGLPNILLPAGSTIYSSTSGLQGGDQWSQIRLTLSPT